MNWRTARACESGACVEIGQDAAVIAVRDTTDRDGAALEYGGEAWAAFTLRVKRSAGRGATGRVGSC